MLHIGNITLADSGAERVYGPKSQIIQTINPPQDYAGDLFSSQYNIVIMVIIVAICIIVRNNWSRIAAYITQLSRPNRKILNIQSFSGIDKPYADYLLIIVWAVGVALFVLKSFTVFPIAPYSVFCTPNMLWYFILAAILGVLSIITFQYLLLLIIGFVVHNYKTCKELFFLKRILNVIFSLISFPFIMGVLLTEGTTAKVMVLLMILASVVCLLIFLKETAKLFRSHQISIVIWILYLCVLEFFPLTLFLAPICRQHACI